jgi:hypothetical protein
MWMILGHFLLCLQDKVRTTALSQWVAARTETANSTAPSHTFPSLFSLSIDRNKDMSRDASRSRVLSAGPHAHSSSRVVPMGMPPGSIELHNNVEEDISMGESLGTWNWSGQSTSHVTSKTGVSF